MSTPAWILEEISRRGGAVSFAQFMELALYHPTNGYYSGDTPRYGRHGDFLTAPTASSWYGIMMARWVGALAGRCGPVTLVDLAAGDGSLLVTVMDELGTQAPKALCRVVAVEPSPAMRERAARRLAGGDGRLTVVAALAQSPQENGTVVVHASELYDALPVHRVVMRSQGLVELWVEVDRGSLAWTERAPDPAVGAYLASHGIELGRDQIAEVNLRAQQLHAEILSWAGERAVCIVLDYGYEARRLYNQRGRSSGSLACYREHRLSRDPLVSPGEQDITAHVNWDDLRRAAAAAGWQEVALWSLAELLVRGGLADETEQRGLGMQAELDAATIRQRQEIKRLLDPEGMGSDLKALLQATPTIIEHLAAVFAHG